MQPTVRCTCLISTQDNTKAYIPLLRFFRITRDDELFDSGDDYDFFDNDDFQSEESSDDDSTILLWLAIPPFLGAMAMGLGAIFTFTAVFGWKHGGSTQLPHVSAEE